MSERLRALLLGGFRLLHDGGTPEAVQSARLQDLVTYLLLQPGVPHPRGALASLFWPDSSDGQARTNLRKLVMDLRRCLPNPERFADITDKAALGSVRRDLAIRSFRHADGAAGRRQGLH